MPGRDRSLPISTLLEPRAADAWAYGEAKSNLTNTSDLVAIRRLAVYIMSQLVDGEFVITNNTFD